MTERRVHLAGPEDRWTACGLSLTEESRKRIPTSESRDGATCLRCIGGAYASREKLGKL